MIHNFCFPSTYVSTRRVFTSFYHLVHMLLAAINNYYLATTSLCAAKKCIRIPQCNDFHQRVKLLHRRVNLPSPVRPPPHSPNFLTDRRVLHICRLEGFGNPDVLIGWAGLQAVSKGHPTGSWSVRPFACCYYIARVLRNHGSAKHDVKATIAGQHCPSQLYEKTERVDDGC
jgi:hypothetical protein